MCQKGVGGNVASVFIICVGNELYSNFGGKVGEVVEL